MSGAVLRLQSVSTGRDYTATTALDGTFSFVEIRAGRYEISVHISGREWKSDSALIIEKEGALATSLEIKSSGQVMQIAAEVPGGQTPSQATGGERLSSAEVSSLPLNARDFSKLLLLAAGTMTDANGAANFTQQFAVNGQRGVTTIFAMDGFDTTDPEMGGDLLEFQRGCHPGSRVQFRRAACRGWTWGS